MTGARAIFLAFCMTAGYEHGGRRRPVQGIV
jgi:hypothetical protein